MTGTLSTVIQTFGIAVFPLIAIRGSETLTVGIGVFPLIVIRGSFIVFPLSVNVSLMIVSAIFAVNSSLYFRLAECPELFE